ncbi:cysteine desulfurase family protein [Halobacillus sp. Marseille-Q1614]|uniref:cysteine desulfurase family protein n=1 Tax=Halobacillus sp. Marseille-Q1614 TaxID=2709134 RepID=UPI0015705318|nr:cysteine desulfurase family protein [Halobacillus sp. Marseille-Q1614]
MIYFDNSATTQPHTEVLQSYQQAAARYFANPSSVHQLGLEAERLMEKTREAIAHRLAVLPEEIVYTSGGTESNNMAIKGIAFQHRTRGRHLITSKIEHPSVLEAFRALEQLGFEVTYVNVDSEGHVDPEEIRQAIRKDTILISIMSVNNELGTVQPIKDIGEIAREHPKLFFHVDHVQGVGKVPLPFKDCHIDLCSLSGHKIHGVKGTGMLYARKEIRLFPLLHGGGHEDNRRSGTENLPGMVAFAKALRLIQEQEEDHLADLLTIRNFLRKKLDSMDPVTINSPEKGSPHILNISIPGLKPEVVVHALAERGIFVSTKSACSSKEPDVSAVLKACNLNPAVTTSALRISLSYQNTVKEAETFIKELKDIIRYLKG